MWLSRMVYERHIDDALIKREKKKKKNLVDNEGGASRT